MRSRYVRKPALRRVVTLLDCTKCRVQRLLRHVWTDLSAWALVLTNMITISAAFLEHWSFSTIIWVYWCQILIIGVFAFLRTIALTDFSLTGVERIRFRFTLKGKLRAGAFFLAHFTVVAVSNLRALAGYWAGNQRKRNYFAVHFPDVLHQSSVFLHL